MSDDPYVLFESSEGRMIDVALARRLIEGQFPQWSHLPITAVELDGWDNRSFRLGSELTVRLPSGNWYAQQVEKEQRWLPVLAPKLPLPIPVPLAQGVPADGYPFPWSVYGWLDGKTARLDRIENPVAFATELAEFLAALQRIDPTGGPPAGPHSFFRGGPLATYDAETRRTIEALHDEIPVDEATVVWAAALAAQWPGPPVWFHGDVAAGNLLVGGGRLTAVIDFGTCGVGDPACDVVIAWTLLSGASREAFRAAFPADSATWARGRGWALWKALITLNGHLDTDPVEATAARRTIDDVLLDHRRFS